MASERKRARSRRSSVSAARPRSYSELYKREPSTPLPASTSGTAAAPVAGETVDWTHEYAYVFHDLRRLGIITGVLVALIVVASFIF